MPTILITLAARCSLEIESVGNPATAVLISRADSDGSPPDERASFYLYG